VCAAAGKSHYPSVLHSLVGELVLLVVAVMMMAMMTMMMMTMMMTMMMMMMMMMMMQVVNVGAAARAEERLLRQSSYWREICRYVCVARVV